MDGLKSLIKEYLYDTMYEAECVLRSDRDQNITILTDNLRALGGVTVVTMLEPATPVNAQVERCRIKVKFFMTGQNMKAHLKQMSLDARKITGVHSFIPVNVRKFVSRIYRQQ